MNGQTYTRGVVADLELPGLDRPALIAALGPWAGIVAFCERHGARYIVAAGVLGAAEAECTSIALFADDVLAAVHDAHAQLGARYGCTTRWHLFVAPDLRGMLHGALGYHTGEL